MKRLEEQMLKYSLIRDDLMKIKYILESNLYNKNNEVEGICSAIIILYSFIKLKKNFKDEYKYDLKYRGGYDLTYNYIQDNLPRLTIHKILHSRSLYCWKIYKKEPRIKWLNKHIKKLNKEIEKLKKDILKEYGKIFPEQYK